VTDRGSGMDEATIASAFDRGFSPDGSSGLGLPLCKIIIEEHGGTISITAPPGGTEILFTIPLAEEEIMNSPLILVVEDDKNISRATRAMLELEGYRVYTADTLAEGKALTEKYNPT
jgi:hypothetical protein